MAEALLAAGFNAQGFDIRPMSEFGDFAHHLAPSIEQFGVGLETLISVVRDIPQTEELLFGRLALLQNAPDLKTIVISSTVAPSYLAKLRARLPQHISLVDAPMSGAPAAARERRLSFMLGGDAQDIDALLPMFKAMGRDIHRIGQLGAGMTAKVLNNLVAASSVCATRLVLDRAKDCGINADEMLAVLNSSSGQTWFGSNFQSIDWADEGFDPTNTMAILKKDVQSALSIMDNPTEMALGATVIDLLSTMKPAG